MFDEIDFQPEQYDLAEEPDWRFDLAGADQTVALGERIAAAVEPGDVVGLSGQLGAGKTTFVGGMVDALGGEGRTRSPTYTLVNTYQTDPPVYHVDLYRLETVDDLESIGYWDYIRQRRGILCVEWLDRLPEAWPGEGVVIRLEHLSEGRRASIWATGTIREQLESRLRDFGGSP
jgi:tRNA threonylcarbamoyl adenosine modification protein YjeE